MEVALLVLGEAEELHLREVEGAEVLQHQAVEGAGEEAEVLHPLLTVVQVVGVVQVPLSLAEGEGHYQEAAVVGVDPHLQFFHLVEAEGEVAEAGLHLSTLGVLASDLPQASPLHPLMTESQLVEQAEAAEHSFLEPVQPGTRQQSCCYLEATWGS